jgi:hypothetical protein
MELCASVVPFTVISNSADILFRSAYSSIDSSYTPHRTWYYEKACDILDNPDDYLNMNCTEIVDGFKSMVHKKVIALHKENNAWYGALAS